MNSIRVRVTPNSKFNKVSPKGDFFIIKVTEPAKEGRANKAMIRLLSDFFNVSKSRVIVRKGEKSRTKKVEIL